ncbi:MAG: chromosomal replication initiator protein DnaA [Planctomycetota bacterium]|nr:chromosomal replication initiator protein DnaA [Planctomycetota bacterium]
MESLRAEMTTTEAILKTLQDRIGPQCFNAWFRGGATVILEDAHVRVSVPNPFVAHWVETHYCGEIAESAQAHTGLDRPVLVTVDPSLSGKVRQGQLDKQADSVAKANEGRARPRRLAPRGLLRYHLKDFIVGESNKLAYSAALAAASPEGPRFTPLFIHGACGVGKTHLLQGICNAVAGRRRGEKPFTWAYLTAEQFTNDFIQAIGQKKTAEFRARYRGLDLLAIDDVHFLAAKKATEEEFLHTFNAIQTAGRQVVLASDAPPNLVGRLNEQLASRFMAGMTVRVDPPDAPTRLAILRRKVETAKLHVTPEVIDYLAAHVRGSVRELEGALIKLTALAALHGETLSLQRAREALADHIARTDSVVTLGDIEAVAASFFGVTPADIHSSRRTRTVSAARMVMMFLARRHTTMSFPEIARYAGKNHSSAVLAVQRMERLLADGSEIAWTGPAGVKSMPAEELVAMLAAEFPSR